MSENSQFLYISSKITKTIIKSQVVNWVKLLNNSGSVKFHILFQVPIIDLLRKKFRDEYKHIEQEINAKVYTIPILRTKWNLWVDQWLLYIFILCLSKNLKKKNLPLIIQTRVNKYSRLIKKLKKKRKTGFIYEHRGVGAEEYINSLGYNSISEVSNNKIKKRYYVKLTEYQLLFSLADIIINVSEKMKQYVLETFKLDNERKLEVIPGSADETLFYFDFHLRNVVRQTLRLTNENTVLLYSGKLEQKWHMSEFLFESVASIQKSLPNVFFLCLTPDTEIANKLCCKFKLNESAVEIRFVKNEEINQYLNAADFGLVFRKNSATNRYASPTKIAEYLLAGLPVLVSDNIGDYSNFIRKHDLGIVTDNSISSILQYLSSFNNVDRSYNSHVASAHYSKQRQLNKYLKIFENLTKELQVL